MTGRNKSASRDRKGRFRKGATANPKGRPPGKRRPPPSSFDVVLDRRMSVTQGGETRELTVEEALGFRTLMDALAGVRSAEREVLKWIGRREKAMAEREAERAPLPSVDHKFVHDPDNADEALLLLGIATEVEGLAYIELRLEPWAVQAALSRRRGGNRLSDDDIATIRRCTRAPETLRFPKGYRDHE